MADFKIVITASDKATATVRKVKDSIAQFTRPLTQVKSSVGALGKELGIDKMTKGLGRMAAGARKVAEKAAGAVVAVAAIAGVSSLAGIAALSRGWAMLGLQIGRSAGVLDMATMKFQTLTGAAEAFGLERGAMEAGLKSLGDTMEDALYGRNQEALMMMRRLGLEMHKTKNGSVDAAQGLYDVADAVARIKNVQAQGVVARTMGVENLLPFLQQGSKGIKQYEDAVRRSGAAMSPELLAKSEQFGRSLIFLKLAATGLGNSIMGQLLPILQPMVDKITGWTVANRDLVATRVKDFVTGLAKPMLVVLGLLGDLITKTIGWKGAGMALAAVLGAYLIPSVWGLVKPLATVALWAGSLAVGAFPALALRAGLLAAALGWDGVAGAFVAIGAAIEATPVGWILTALAAIGLAGYELWKHWKDIKDGFVKIWDAIPQVFLAGYRKLEPTIKALSYIPIIGAPFRMAEAAVGGLQGRVNAKSVEPQVAARAMAFYQSKGWSRENAAGLVGNMAWESGLNPQQTGDGGAAIGIAQWHKDRQAAFKRWSGGKDIGTADLQSQLEFSHFELTQGSEKRAGDALRKQNSVQGSALAVEYGYERPDVNAAASSANARASLAQQFFDGQAPAKPGAQDHKVAVEVHIKGLPKGATTEVKSSTPGVRPTVKVDYAMPDLATM